MLCCFVQYLEGVWKFAYRVYPCSTYRMLFHADIFDNILPNAVVPSNKVILPAPSKTAMNIPPSAAKAPWTVGQTRQVRSGIQGFTCIWGWRRKQRYFNLLLFNIYTRICKRLGTQRRYTYSRMPRFLVCNN